MVTNEPMKIEEYAKIIRSMFEHENTLRNNRMTWMLVVQGLLFAAFTKILNNPVEISILIATLGIIISISFFVSFLYTSKATNKLKQYWDDRLNEHKIDIEKAPPIIGLRHDTEPLLTKIFYVLMPWNVLP